MQKKLLVFVCLLFSFLIVNSLFSVVHAPYIGENCALYLPMNEGSGIITYDQSGNGNNGLLLPLIIGPTWVDGKYGKALSFDGSNDYVDCGSPASLDNLEEVTYSLWLNRDTLGTRHFFISKSSVYFGIQADNRIETTIVYSTQNAISYSTPTIPANAFRHIVITYSESGDRKIHLYINGAEVAYDRQDVSIGTRTSDASDNLWIGDHVGGGIPFDGIIDDVHIYNRTLTQAEITVLYNAGFTSTHSETIAISDILTQKQEQKQVLTQVFSYSDGSTMTQEQKYSLTEIVTTTTVLTHGLEVPVTFLEVFNSETLHITDTLRIWQEHKYIFPSTITFNESPTFQNFVLEIYTYINEVLAVAAIAFILAVTALALILVSQRQKD